MNPIEFTRSNVSENMLNISNPKRSTFDFYSRHRTALPIGRFIPVGVKKLMPNSVMAGTIQPEFTLENVSVPEIGPVRLDTHTVVVSNRRINRKWIKVIEGTLDNCPTVDLSRLFNYICSNILGVDTPTAFTLTYGSTIGTSENEWVYDVEEVYKDAINFYQKLCTPEASDYGYMKDFYASEVSRLKSLYGQLKSQRLFPSTQANSYQALMAVYNILLPYFGEGSLLDNIKYPILGFYNPVLNMLRAYNVKWESGGDPLDVPPILQSGIHLIIGLDWSLLYRSVDVELGTNYPKNVTQDKEFFSMSEDPIRACFVAWYDALRNWHVEEKKNLPDITEWETSSLFRSDVQHVLTFNECAMYLIPRYRTWGNDIWTTIQTDDAFRHVMNPIFDHDIVGNAYAAISDDESTIDMMLQSIYNIDGHLYPQGFHRFVTGVEGEYSILYNDLISMRRSGMMERYLAHKYYNPDTFLGATKASWGIDKSDLSATSEYISGSSEFISGEQLKSATGTDGMNGTPAGTRTFTGGVSSIEETSFASGVDFCYVVTFVSIMPIPEYDAKDLHCYETQRVSLPYSEFADDTRVQIMSADMIRGIKQTGYAGFVPRYLGYRSELDSVHGEYLRRYRPYCWLRDYHAVRGADVFQSIVSYGNLNPLYGELFAIGAYGLHVHVSLDAFDGKENELDPVAYGSVKFNLAIECPMAAAIEYL